MQHMEPNRPGYEQPGSAYRGYEENPEYGQPQRETPYRHAPQSNTYDDDFVEAIAQRIVQRMGQGSAGKVYAPTYRKVSGPRVALAIMSVIMVVPLSTILLVGLGGLAGLIAFSAACLALLLINATFNLMVR